MNAVGGRSWLRLGPRVGKRRHHNQVDHYNRVISVSRKAAACLLFPCWLVFASLAIAQTPADKLGKLVHGSIVTTEGQPVRDARVEIRDLHGVQIGSSVTNSAGSFKIITAAKSGQCLVRADKASQVGTQ